MEAQDHTEVSFLTLTYAEEFLPAEGLRYRDMTLFVKRLRKAIAPTVVRFYGTGEYGEKHSRPHYHLILFGYPPCTFGLSRYKDQAAKNKILSCCSPCDLIRNVWTHPKTWAPLGHVQLEAIRTPGVFSYVMGYVTKKLDKDNPLLEGRTPEAARMSRRPGIGFGYVKSIGRALMTPPGLRQMARDGDVPNHLWVAKKRWWMLDRYLRKKLREEVGLNEEEIKLFQARRNTEEMLRMSPATEEGRTLFSKWLKEKMDRDKARPQIERQAIAQMKRRGL